MITIELLLIMTFLGVALVVGLSAVRNALFSKLVRKQAEIPFVEDAADTFVGRVIRHNLCDQPQFLCADPPPPAATVTHAFVGVGSPDCLALGSSCITTVDRVYFAGADCTGLPYLAVAGGSLPVSFFNVRQDVYYAVGPGNVIYKADATAVVAGGTEDVFSVFTSLTDCAPFSPTDVLSGSFFEHTHGVTAGGVSSTEAPPSHTHSVTIPIIGSPVVGTTTESPPDHTHTIPPLGLPGVDSPRFGTAGFGCFNLPVQPTAVAPLIAAAATTLATPLMFPLEVTTPSASSMPIAPSDEGLDPMPPNPTVAPSDEGM